MTVSGTTKLRLYSDTPCKLEVNYTYMYMYMYMYIHNRMHDGQNKHFSQKLVVIRYGHTPCMNNSTTTHTKAHLSFVEQ